MNQNRLEPNIGRAEDRDSPQLAELYYETVMPNARQYYTEAQTQTWVSFALNLSPFAQLFAEATTF
jgi:hypothetical protein